MEHRRLGRTGLQVSWLGLGTMTWSRDTDEHDARELLRDFVDAGGTLVDTSASYAEGGAEALLGSLLGGAVARRDVTIVTKGGVRRTADGAVVDASRGALLDALDGSLDRLGTDHVDVWLVQTPDPRTPLEETASALRLAVSSGRARYVGLSNHAGWQVARAASLLEADPGLAAVEAEYSLLQRGVEREALPAAENLGAGLLAWSALGRGVLTGKYRRTVPADSRAASAHLAGFVQPYLTRPAAAVVEALVTRRGRPRLAAGPRRGRLRARRAAHAGAAAPAAGRGRPRAAARAGDRARRRQRADARLPRTSDRRLTARPVPLSG